LLISYPLLYLIYNTHSELAVLVLWVMTACAVMYGHHHCYAAIYCLDIQRNWLVIHFPSARLLPQCRYWTIVILSGGSQSFAFGNKQIQLHLG